jgi:hypothetical protein
MQHCFNCGAELVVYRSYYGQVENCGAPECMRAEREMHAAERDEAHRQLDEDMGYGGW